MDPWLDELADALGVARLEDRQAAALLRLAREVAHGVERKLAPLSTFLVGVAVGVRVGSSGREVDAFTSALQAARGVLPPAVEEGGG